VAALYLAEPTGGEASGTAFRGAGLAAKPAEDRPDSSCGATPAASRHPGRSPP